VLGTITFPKQMKDFSTMHAVYDKSRQHQADVKRNQISGFVFQTKCLQDMDEQEANAKLVLGTIYILLGMGLISMCINLMQEKIVSQVPLVIFFLAIIKVVIIITIITNTIVIIKMPLQLQLL
jgi:hypothetical protein